MNSMRNNTKVEANGISKHFYRVEKNRLLQRKWILGSVGLTVTFVLWLSFENRNSQKQKTVQSSETEAIYSSNLANRPIVINQPQRIQEENTKTNIQTYPDETYLSSILSKWLEIKTQVLSGSRIPESIQIVGTTEAIEQLKAERREDKLREETQKISAQLIDLKIIRRLPDLIEVNATLSYSDKRLNQSSDVIERTPKHVFKKRYILVNRDSVWQVL